MTIVLKILLIELVNILIFIIQFAFALALFCLILLFWISYLAPESELFDSTLKTLWISGLAGFVSIIIGYSLSFYAERLPED